MKINTTWLRPLKTLLFLCAILFPFVWIVIGGILRTPIYILGGLFGIYLLRKHRLQTRLGSYALWAAAGSLLVIMGQFRLASPSQQWPTIWYFLMIFYAVPAGILLAHWNEEFKPMMNWTLAFIMLVFAAWSYLVMQKVDVEHVVILTNDTATRGDQAYPVELFGIFSWENVKMQLIPWCAYPFAALLAVACRTPLVVRGILLGASALGCYVAGAFLTRTVFMAAGFAVVIVTVVYMVKANRNRRLVIVLTILLLAGACMSIVRYIPVVNEYVMGLLDRFSYTADDSRRYLWASSYHLMLNYPLGGGDAYLEDHFWAHDLPLDLGLLYGIPGFLCISGLLSTLIYWVVKWICHLRGEFEFYEIILLSVFIAAMVSCLISPPDLAFLTPMLLVGAFAKERAWMEASHARARRRANVRAALLASMPATTEAHVQGFPGVDMPP
jgi:hypothetical protein